MSKMNKMLQSIRDMHIQFNISNNTNITTLMPEEKTFRVAAMREEIEEYETAESLEDELDALVDLTVFALGTAERQGMLHIFQEAFDRVMIANCNKELGPNQKRGSFALDLVKPDNREAPCHTDLVYNKRPILNKKVVVIGHAKHGKDQFSKFLDPNFKSSSDVFFKEVAYPTLSHFYATPEDLAKDKDNIRPLLYQIMAQYTAEDPAIFARKIFKENNVYCGVRRKEELQAIIDEGLADYIVWIDRSGSVASEPKTSITVTPFQATHGIVNNGTLEQLKAAAYKFVAEIESHND